MGLAAERTANGTRSFAIVVTLALVVVCGAFLAPLVFYPPAYNDELIHYHPIACREFPLAEHHDFRAPCGRNGDLRVLGVWLPARSYSYAGATVAALYYPFYRVLPDLLSARLLGVLCLVLFAWGLARATGMGLAAASLLGVLCFPVAVQTIIDTGPVRVQLLIAVWGVFAVGWLLAQVPSWRTIAVSLLLGVGFFVGIEQKALFLVLLPGILVLGVLLFRLDEDRASTSSSLPRRSAAVLVPALVAAGALALALFSATTRDGRTYASVLDTASQRISPLDVASQLGHFRDHLARYFRDFLIFGDRVFVPARRGLSLWTVLYWLCLLVALPLATIGARGARRGLAGFAICVALFAATIWAINLQARSWAGHHVILAWPFLLVGAGLLVRTLERGGRGRHALALLGVMALSQVALQRELLARPIHPYSSPDRDAVHRHLDESGLASDSVLVVLDWGSYYVKSLYGPADQLVVYVDPLRERDLVRLRGLAGRLDRRLAFVARPSSRVDFALLADAFPGLERARVPGARDEPEWELWLAPEPQ